MLGEAGFYSLISLSSPIQKLSEPCHLGTLWRSGYICLRDWSNDHWWLTQAQPVSLCKAEQGQTDMLWPAYRAADSHGEPGSHVLRSQRISRNSGVAGRGLLGAAEYLWCTQSLQNSRDFRSSVGEWRLRPINYSLCYHNSHSYHNVAK